MKLTSQMLSHTCLKPPSCRRDDRDNRARPAGDRHRAFGAKNAGPDPVCQEIRRGRSVLPNARTSLLAPDGGKRRVLNYTDLWPCGDRVRYSRRANRIRRLVRRLGHRPAVLVGVSLLTGHSVEVDVDVFA